MPRRQGIVRGIYISPEAGQQMRDVSEALAIAGQGLEGDRYCLAQGSFNKERLGYRQVTLISAQFFPGTSFNFSETRRNIVVDDIEIYDFLRADKPVEFQIGEEVVMLGIRYCDPCQRPGRIAGKPADISFRKEFWEHGGIIANILVGGRIRVGDPVIGPHKDYD